MLNVILFFINFRFLFFIYFYLAFHILLAFIYYGCFSAYSSISMVHLVYFFFFLLFLKHMTQSLYPLYFSLSIILMDDFCTLSKFFTFSSDRLLCQTAADCSITLKIKSTFLNLQVVLQNLWPFLEEPSWHWTSLKDLWCENHNWAYHIQFRVGFYL